MKKLKGFYQNNRVYCILMIISIICLIAIMVFLATTFLGQTKNSVYGNRLAGIESVKITNEHKEEIKKFIEEQKIVEKASINIKGKIVYINVYLNDGKVDDAQSLAIKVLEKFTTEEKDYYDINYTFTLNSDKEKEDSPFPIMGYKKADQTIISWTKSSGE
jgi:hypothetical protein